MHSSEAMAATDFTYRCDGESTDWTDVMLPKQYQKELTKKENSKVKITREENQIEVEKKEAKRKQIEAQADADVIKIRGEHSRTTRWSSGIATSKRSSLRIR